MTNRELCEYPEAQPTKTVDSNDGRREVGFAIPGSPISEQKHKSSPQRTDEDYSEPIGCVPHTGMTLPGVLIIMANYIVQLYGATEGVRYSGPAD